MKISSSQALILSFTLLAFVLGTTEYIIVGLLGDVARSLHVSVAHAGVLVSAFALAYAAGTPFAMMAASYVPKRLAMLSGIVLVVLLNIGSALSTTYFLLLLTRLFTAVFCGLTVSLAISICTDTLPEEKKGQAIAYVLGGFSIANVVGVPIGTMVGLRLEWPAAFWLVAMAGAICVLVLRKVVPRDLPAVKSSLRDQLRLMTTPRILLAFLIPVIGVAAVFVIYTYITPIMAEVMQIPAEWSSLLLLLYGAATVVSNIIGGKIASGAYLVKMRNMFLLHAAIYALFGITVQSSYLGTLSLIAIAFLSFTINAAAQLYLIQLTESLVPEAKDFASSLMPIGANIGIALGSAAGSFVTGQFGLRYLPWTAVALALLACWVTARSYRLAQPRKQDSSMAA